MPRLKKLYKTLQNNSEGMTLIEVIIALAILGLVAVTFLVGLSTALKATSLADERATAQSLAQSQMEYVKSQNYSSVNAWSYTVSTSERNSSNPPLPWWDPANDEPPLLSNDYAGYCVKVESGQVDAGTGEDEGIRKITVTVYHSEQVDEDEKVLTLEDYKMDR